MEKFKYYNHALVQNCLDCEEISFTKDELKRAFKQNKKALFLVYTTNFDCGYDTGWYYVINDSGTKSINFKSKNFKRKLNVVNNNLHCEEIDPIVFRSDLTKVCFEAGKGYKNYNRRSIYAHFEKWGGLFVGAFYKKELIGFANIHKTDNQINLSFEKTNKQFKQFYPSFALNLFIVNRYCDFDKGDYLSNGTTTINHITNHNQFLIDNFGFRKAFCYLHIVYRLKLKLIMPVVRLLSPFFHLLGKFHFFSLINSFVAMDKIARMQKRQFKDYV